MYCFPPVGRGTHLLHRSHKQTANTSLAEVVELSTAFVLIKTKPMRESEVYRALLELENVVETHVVYGEYDLAARIDFTDDKEMSKILMGEFRNIPGVEQTETLIAVEV
ncbi:MAG: Lrp/AsnC family transcriptional regulator [Candidatus Thalassarchaeaceae archaeon]